MSPQQKGKMKKKGFPPEERVKVVVRMRGLNANESQMGTSILDVGSRSWKVKSNKTCVQTTNTGESLPEKIGRTIFSYDRVFDEYASTEEIYEESSHELVKSFVKGVSGSILAYGQSSSGKTYTMQGERSIKEGSESQNGVIQMIIRDIFSELTNFPISAFLIRLSMIEVYNEEIRDLLSSSGDKKIITRYDPKIGLSVDSVEKLVTDYASMIDLFSIADEKRVVRNTEMNEKSSRSHVIYRITLEKKDLNIIDGDSANEAVQVSTLNIMDLAGFGTVGRKPKHLDDVQKESISINKSLLALSHVMADLARSKNGFVNYRESTLTRILQKDLKSQCKLAIICCISPSGLHTEQTRKTLEFGRYAKGVKTRPIVKDVIDNRSLIIKTLRDFDIAKSEPGYPERQCKLIEEEWNKIEKSMLIGADICTLFDTRINDEKNKETETTCDPCSAEKRATEAEVQVKAIEEEEEEQILTEPRALVNADRDTSLRTDDDNAENQKRDRETSPSASVAETKIITMQQEWNSIRSDLTSEKQGSDETAPNISEAEMKIIAMEQEWSSIKRASTVRLSLEVPGVLPRESPNKIPNEIQFLVEEEKDKQVQEGWSRSGSAGRDDIQFSDEEITTEKKTMAAVEDIRDGPEREDNDDSSQSIDTAVKSTLESLENNEDGEIFDTLQFSDTENLSQTGLEDHQNTVVASKYDNDISIDYTDNDSSIFISSNAIKVATDETPKAVKCDGLEEHRLLLSYSEDTSSNGSTCNSATSNDIASIESTSDESEQKVGEEETIEMIEKESNSVIMGHSSDNRVNSTDEEDIFLLKTSMDQLNIENYELKRELDGYHEIEKVQNDTIDSTKAENFRLLQLIDKLKEGIVNFKTVDTQDFENSEDTEDSEDPGDPGDPEDVLDLEDTEDEDLKQSEETNNTAMKEDSDFTGKLLDDCASSSLEVDNNPNFFSDSDTSSTFALQTGLQKDFVRKLREITSEDFKNAKNGGKLFILGSCISKLRAELETRKNELKECHKMKSLHIVDMENIQDENRRLLSDIVNLKERNATMMEERNVHNLEIKMIRDKVHYLERENDKLRDEKTESSKYMQHRLSILEKENQDLREVSSKVNQREIEIKQLKEQIKWLEVEKEGMRKDARKAANFNTEMIGAKNMVETLERDMPTEDNIDLQVSVLANRIIELESLSHEFKLSPASSADHEPTQTMISNVEPSFSITSKESSEISLISSTISSVQDSLKSSTEKGGVIGQDHCNNAYNAAEGHSAIEKENICTIVEYEHDFSTNELKSSEMTQNTEENLLKQWENLSFAFKDLRQNLAE